jgi:ribosomal protein S12 methylthiotransferase accessory factor
LTSDRRFKLAPGIELVRVSEGRYTLRSEFDAVELSGDAAADLAENVLAGLHEPVGLDEIRERLPGYSLESITNQLEALAGHGLVVEVSNSIETAPRPMAALLETMGRDADNTARVLQNATVAVFGLEAHGAHLARMLAQIGIGTVRLVDPFAFEEGHLALTPVTETGMIGRARQDAVAGLLTTFGGRTELMGRDDLDAAAVRDVVAGCDLVFGCWDQAFGAATHWLNRAALDTGVPSLFGELRATTTLAGPLYLPSLSACWMCYRMRGVACAPDFEQAIAFEEHLDRARRPSLVSRATIPILAEVLASTMAMEALRLLTGIHPPVLVDNVSEYDAITNDTETHPVLVVPDCPVCSKKKPARTQPALDELIAHAPPPTDLTLIADRLVDARTGIVSQFGAVPRDPSEVPIPYVWRARLANHKFLSEHDEERATCSGKGMTRSRAWASCLGEAVERYSGATWRLDELVIAARRGLDGRSLDPRDLVLYADDQYASLAYARYHDDAELAWVRARSLVVGDEVWVPAVAVLMDYPVQSPDEYLFPITSNGLAAGPTPHESVLNALTEVLERDATLITWLNRLPGHPHDAGQHPDEDVRHLARLYRRRGIELSLIEVPTDHPVSVFLGIALMTGDGDGPSAAVGLGADLDPIAAARKAALEVGQVRPSIRRRARMVSPERVDELAADPLQVTSLEDHALLYAHPSTAGEFRFLFGDARPWEPRPRTDPADALRLIVEHFGAVGQDALYVDLTPPDMASLGVYTARVVVPGFQPIWFGRGERRLGGRRLFEFPFDRGLRPTTTERSDLNPMPHPIA